MRKRAIIERQGSGWVLRTRDGRRVLGRHATREAAERQERAIQMAKHALLVKAGAAPPAASVLRILRRLVALASRPAVRSAVRNVAGRAALGTAAYVAQPYAESAYAHERAPRQHTSTRVLTALAATAMGPKALLHPAGQTPAGQVLRSLGGLTVLSAPSMMRGLPVRFGLMRYTDPIPPIDLPPDASRLERAREHTIRAVFDPRAVESSRNIATHIHTLSDKEGLKNLLQDLWAGSPAAPGRPATPGWGTKVQTGLQEGVREGVRDLPRVARDVWAGTPKSPGLRRTLPEWARQQWRGSEGQPGLREVARQGLRGASRELGLAAAGGAVGMGLGQLVGSALWSGDQQPVGRVASVGDLERLYRQYDRRRRNRAAVRALGLGLGAAGTVLGSRAWTR